MKIFGTTYAYDEYIAATPDQASIDLPDQVILINTYGSNYAVVQACSISPNPSDPGWSFITGSGPLITIRRSDLPEIANVPGRDGYKGTLNPDALDQLLSTGKRYAFAPSTFSGAVKPLVTSVAAGGSAVAGRMALVGAEASILATSAIPIMIGLGVGAVVLEYYNQKENAINIAKRPDTFNITDPVPTWHRDGYIAPTTPGEPYQHIDYDVSDYKNALQFLEDDLSHDVRTNIATEFTNDMGFSMQNTAQGLGLSSTDLPDLTPFIPPLAIALKKGASTLKNSTPPPNILASTSTKAQEKTAQNTEKLADIASDTAESPCTCEMLIVEAINALTLVMTPALISWGSVATLLGSFLTGHALTKDELADLLIIDDPSDPSKKINLLEKIAFKPVPDIIVVEGES